MLGAPIDRPGQRLRDLFAEGTVLMPGVFNAISAVSAHKAGASALYLTGAGLTNGTLGAPDIALATLTEFAQQASYVSAAAPLPVLSDADTGFGSSFNVARTVHEMERAGLAGIHIEDQLSPKRCGHLEGKELVSLLEMSSKVRIAVSAKRDKSFVVVARTDARGVEGLEGAISRARAYVQAGADAIFPEGLTSEAEFEAFRAEVEGPLLANMTEFGKTPLIPVDRFSELGYQMVIFPMTAFRVMIKAFEDTYSTLMRDGSQAALLDQMKSRKELYDLIDYDAYAQLDQSLAYGDL